MGSPPRRFTVTVVCILLSPHYKPCVSYSTWLEQDNSRRFPDHQTAISARAQRVITLRHVAGSLSRPYLNQTTLPRGLFRPSPLFRPLFRLARERKLLDPARTRLLLWVPIPSLRVPIPSQRTTQHATGTSLEVCSGALLQQLNLSSKDCLVLNCTRNHFELN